eukprot:g2325.t1
MSKTQMDKEEEFKIYPADPKWSPASGVPPPPPETEGTPSARSVALKFDEGEEAKATNTNDAKDDDSGFSISGVQEKTLRTIFTLLDSDQDNLLDVKQLRTAIISMGIPPAAKLIEDILKSVPERFGGRGVDFDTLRDVMSERLRCNPIKMRDIDELFRSFEGTHNGTISDVSMRHIMGVETMNKTSLSDENIDEMFDELGIKRKDPIRYREFMKQISSGFMNFVDE